jgi:hypothetical protein
MSAMRFRIIDQEAWYLVFTIAVFASRFGQFWQLHLSGYHIIR